MRMLDFYIAMAKMQRNDATVSTALERFVEAYPASIHRLEARMALGDHYFYNNDFAAALRGYEGIPASAFDATSAATCFSAGRSAG